MKNNWKTVSAGALFILLGQIAAVQFGWYEGPGVWFDLLLHFVSGAILAMVWVIISADKLQTKSVLLFTLAAGGFALIGSFGWELFELLAGELTPTVANQYEIAASTTKEALTDMLAGLLGGLYWGWRTYIKS